MTAATPAAPSAGTDGLAALAKGGRTNIVGFVLRLAGRVPFLFIAGRLYGPDAVGRFALAVVVVELGALVATLGLKRGLAQALAATKRPHAHVVADALVVALMASLLVSALLMAFPQVMYPNSSIRYADRLLGAIVFAPALTDVALSALAYRLEVKPAVTARAIVEPWVITLAAAALYVLTPRDGLITAYILSNSAMLAAALWPLWRSYGWPRQWAPRPHELWALAGRNAPLAGADTIEWGSRNVDRFILGLLFAPKIVGIYYMAQQVASLAQKLKTSFDPILGPVITQSLARDDRAAIASQIRQVGFWIMAAQAGVALIGSLPGPAVMGTIGPEFVAGTAALSFLLTAEVLATMGAVSESALVYIARHVNLGISAAMLVFQILLSFALVYVMRGFDWPIAFQAAGPALALMLSVALTSVIKSNLLGNLLRSRVSGWRWPLVAACLAACVVGALFRLLPPAFEWAQLVIGIPAIAATYAWVLWRWAFGRADRALFGRLERAGATPTGS